MANTPTRATDVPFEVPVDEFQLAGNPALVCLAAILHAADITGELEPDPLGTGLLAVGEGGLHVEADDHRLLERCSFVYDALYAWCQRAMATESPAPAIQS